MCIRDSFKSLRLCEHFECGFGADPLQIFCEFHNDSKWEFRWKLGTGPIFRNAKYGARPQFPPKFLSLKCYRPPPLMDERNSPFVFVLPIFSSKSSMASTVDSGLRTFRKIQMRVS